MRNMINKNKFLEEVFQNRFTCKSYDPEKKVSDEDFNTIMEVARLSPSSMGYEPWKFVLLKNKRVIEELRPHAWGAINAFNGASHFVLVLSRMPKDIVPGSDYLLHIEKDIQHFPEDLSVLRRKNYEKFYESDFKIGESNRAGLDWTAKQSYIPLANMLTAAAVLGIDSTPIEGFELEKVHKVLVRNKVYDPKHFKIATMIAFGYSNKEHREKTRRPMDEVWEIYE